MILPYVDKNFVHSLTGKVWFHTDEKILEIGIQEIQRYMQELAIYLLLSYVILPNNTVSLRKSFSQHQPMQ